MFEPIIPLFQPGGALKPGDHLYIERSADTKLTTALSNGEFCYILAPSQIGKTSLQTRAAEQLRRQNICCVELDMRRLVSDDVTESELYFGLIEEFCDKMGFPEEDAVAYWTAHEDHAARSPVWRWSRFLHEHVLENTNGPIVVFIDEIQRIRELSFPSAPFFASMQELYDARAAEEQCRRITVCLIGNSTPGDLFSSTPKKQSISTDNGNIRIPPFFNMGRDIHLQDFTAEESQHFLPGLAAFGEQAAPLLEAIISWTNGHPYMTQKLCAGLVERAPVYTASNPFSATSLQAHVDAVVKELFVKRGRIDEPNLAVANRFFQGDNTSLRAVQMLQVYRLLLKGETVTANGQDIAQRTLQLLGMVAEDREDTQPRLRIRNRIFKTVFDHAWLDAIETKGRLAEWLAHWIDASPAERSRLLLRGQDLKEAQQWADKQPALTELEQRFLRDSIQAARLRLLRQAASLATILAVVVIGSITWINFLYSEKSKADADVKTAHKQLADLNNQIDETKKELGKTQRQLGTTQVQLGKSKAAETALVKTQKTLKKNITQSKKQAAEADRAANLATTRAAVANQIERTDQAKLYLTRRGHEMDALISAVQAVGLSFYRHRAIPLPKETEQVFRSAMNKEVILSLQGQQGKVEAVAFASNSNRLATAGADGIARLWDTRTAQPLVTLRGHAGPVLATAFAPGDRYLLTAGADGTARVWNTATLLPTAILRGHSAAVNLLAFSPDGRWLITGSRDHTVRLWDAHTYRPRAVLQGHSLPITSMMFSPDGTRILTASKDGTARLWRDFPSNLSNILLRTKYSNLETALFSRNGKYILTVYQGGPAFLWDGITGLPVATLNMSKVLYKPETWKKVLAAWFSPGSNVYLLTADGALRFWSLKHLDLGGSELLNGREQSEEFGSIQTVSVSSSGRQLAIVGP